MASHHPSRRITPQLRRRTATLVLAATLCSCTTSADTSPAVTTPGEVSAAPGTDPSAAPSGSTQPSITTASVPTPRTVLASVPEPLATTGTLAEQARTVVDTLMDETIDRDPAVLTAFAGAHLPIVMADGRSLTTADDPIGYPWSIVSSATSLSSPRTTVSLSSVFGLFGLVDPTRPFDAAAAADELVKGLRTALASGEATGPAYLANLIAEEARRRNGAELSDPNVGADDLFVESTVAMMITEAALRAIDEVVLERAAEPAPVNGGAERAVHTTSPSAAVDDNPGCDDGHGGWLLWLESKFATGANALGVEWKGLYLTLSEFALSRGRIIQEGLDVVKDIGKATAVGGALINIAILQAQISNRNGTATMDGTGPLIRTKTTDDGSSRTITLAIDYDTGDPHTTEVQNCLLAGLAFAGNNAQLALGTAAGVEVDTTGELGFTKNLAAGNSIVLFGPATFHPTQTADDAGRITVPVQGRRQRYDKSAIDTTEDKQFSIFFEASLDPVTASTIGRALADQVLCIGTISVGDVVDAVAECQNAVVDIIKQFHWDLGEFFFPLTDWDDAGWTVDAVVFPYTLTGFKCGGVGGTWDLYLESATGSFQFSGSMVAEVDPDTLSGPFTFDGVATGGGSSVPVSGAGNVTFVQNADGTASLTVSGDVFGPRGAGASTGVPFSVPLTRDADCSP